MSLTSAQFVEALAAATEACTTYGRKHFKGIDVQPTGTALDMATEAVRAATPIISTYAVESAEPSIRAAERRRYLAEMLASEDAWIGEEEDQWEREKHIIARDIIQGYLTQIEEGDAP